MESLASSYIAAKNKLANPTPFHLLCLASFGPTEDEKMRLVINNSEDIVWNGSNWIAFPVEVDPIKQSRNEVPQLTARVANINQIPQTHIEANSGGVGSIVTFYLVYEGDLAEVTYVPSFKFKVVRTNANPLWVTFTLGATSPYTVLIPKSKILKNFCRYGYPNSRDSRCPYTGGVYSTCNRTLSDCITRNGTDSKYGGFFPSIGKNELYAG